MTRIIPTALALLLAMAVATPALAQSQPGVGAPVDAGKPALLDAAMQTKVRERLREQNLPPADLGTLVIGTVLPVDTTLYALAEDTMTELPTVTRYKFVIVPGKIAVIDPETRAVVQLIDL